MIANDSRATERIDGISPVPLRPGETSPWHVDDLADAPRDFKIPKVGSVQAGGLAITKIDMESVLDRAQQVIAILGRAGSAHPAEDPRKVLLGFEATGHRNIQHTPNGKKTGTR